MLEPDVSQFVVPLKPEFLYFAEVRVGGVNDCVESFESVNSGAFLEESKARKETAVEIHGQQVSSIFVPLCSVVEDSAMAFRSAGRISATITRKEGLRTEKAIRKVLVYENLFFKLNYISILVQSFPLGDSHIFDGESASNALKVDRLLEASYRAWNDVCKGVGA